MSLPLSLDSPYLFHGTGIYCLAKIIADDVLLEGTHWGKPNEPHGPRLTEDVRVASQFSFYNFPDVGGGVLSLDARRLADDFELARYQDRYYNGLLMPEEREIAVITPKIEQLSKYLYQIEVSESLLERAFDENMMIFSQSEGGWPFDDDDFESCKGALTVLTSHHKLIALPPQNYDDYACEAVISTQCICEKKPQFG